MERAHYHSENLVGLLSTKLAVQSLTMHSSGITGGFAGPGIHYHRRAESGPELDAIDRSRVGFPRLGSDPAMAIEEEEGGVAERSGKREMCERSRFDHFQGQHHGAILTALYGIGPEVAAGLPGCFYAFGYGEDGTWAK